MSDMDAAPDIDEILQGVDPSQLATELYDDPMQTMIIETGPVVLNELERSSALWLKLKAIYEETLANHRIENDNPLNEVETARLRGKIQQCKDFLELGEDAALRYEGEAPDDDPALGY